MKGICLQSKNGVFNVIKTKFTQTVMVFEFVSKESNMMPPNIFEHGLRLNSESYMDLINFIVSHG